MAGTFWTIPESLKYLAEHESTEDAVVFLNKYGRHSTMSKGFLFNAAGRFAAQLRRMGFQKGDIFGNSITNSPERLVTDFGIHLAGCVTVNCQVLEKDGADLWHLAEGTKCCAIIASATQTNPAYLFLKKFFRDTPKASGFYDIALSKAPSVKTFILANRVDPHKTSPDTTKEKKEKAASYSDFISDLMATEDEVFVAEVEKSDLAYIFLTSGSTGFSKLVPRTHGELLGFLNSFDTNAGFQKTINDRPFGWTGGYPFMLLSHGHTLFAQDWYEGQQAKTARELWTLYEREEIVGALQSPQMILESIEEFENDPPKYKLNMLFTGGQTATKNIGKAIGLLAHSIIQFYGSTEAFSISAAVITQPDQMKDFLCGKASDGVELKVVDDDFNEVPLGMDGRILCKSQYTFKQYYNTKPSKDLFTSDGFFITGDRGRLDPDGNLYVYGREGEVISRGTLLIYLNWPESLLMTCPGVQEAAVVPVYRKDGEEKICACIIKKEGSDLTEEELKAQYMDKFTASYTSKDAYVPVIDHILFYDTFPVTFTFKTDKLQLKKDAMLKFGNTQQN